MIITNINQKGGVGKTTNTIHIGSFLAMSGKKVLLVDGDPQCDLSAGTGYFEGEFITIKKFMDTPINELKKNLTLPQRADNLFLLPGNIAFDSSDYKRFDLSKKLRAKELGLYDFFDYIFIDTPPEGIKKNSVSTSELALCASDYFVTTIKPDMYSVKNLDFFLDQVLKLSKNHNPTLNFAGIYFSDVLENKNIFKKYHKLLTEIQPDYLFKTYIRRDAEVEKSADSGETIFQFNPNCRAANDFKDLTLELIKRLENGETK